MFQVRGSPMWRSFLIPPRSNSLYARLAFLLNISLVVKFIVKNTFLKSYPVQESSWGCGLLYGQGMLEMHTWRQLGRKGIEKRAGEKSRSRLGWLQGSTWTRPRCGGSWCCDGGCPPRPSPLQPCYCVLDSIHAFLLPWQMNDWKFWFPELSVLFHKHFHWE